jgi:hypothetical protein
VDATKTTLYLPTSLHRRLKAAAAGNGTTISQLVAEGAELVLARYRGPADREEILKRAREAEEELRSGLYEGPSTARDIDDLIYGKAPEDDRSEG